MENIELEILVAAILAAGATASQAQAAPKLGVEYFATALAQLKDEKIIEQHTKRLR